MTNKTPKAFDFGEEPAAPDQNQRAAVPRAFDFGTAELSPSGAPSMPPKAVPKALFESEDHPAVRDALAMASKAYPVVFGHSEQPLAALFRRLLPVKLTRVTEWAETPLMEQAAVLQPVTELVRTFAELGVAAKLEAALESAQPPSSVLSKLFRRKASPAQYKAELLSARAQLAQLMADSELASRKLDESAQELTLHWVALAVVSDLVGRASDATLQDVLLQRRALLQQAVRQAELSILQMKQMRQQAADLMVQVTSFLTVTLPALEMARTQQDR
ncbi:MAG: hypothetical protein V4723_01285 [Pseudomonadota bacterium]